jgi:hypothetical protein
LSPPPSDLNLIENHDDVDGEFKTEAVVNQCVEE